jgi:hypothetical protein
MTQLNVTLTKNHFKCTFTDKENKKHKFFVDGLTLHLNRFNPETNEDVSLHVPLNNTQISIPERYVKKQDEWYPEINTTFDITENEAIQIDCLLKTYLESEKLFKKDE